MFKTHRVEREREIAIKWLCASHDLIFVNDNHHMVSPNQFHVVEKATTILCRMKWMSSSHGETTPRMETRGTKKINLASVSPPGNNTHYYLEWVKKRETEIENEKQTNANERWISCTICFIQMMYFIHTYTLSYSHVSVEIYKNRHTEFLIKQMKSAPLQTHWSVMCATFHLKT